MRQTWVATAVVATMGVTFLLQAESPKPKKAASTDAAASKKEVVHIVIGSGSDLKQVFTYFPYPTPPWPISLPKNQWRTGVYRLTVDPQGNVTQIKILKRMGVLGNWPADVTALKKLILWRAKPGPTRIVDASWTLYPGWQFITNEGSHIPRR